MSLIKTYLLEQLENSQSGDVMSCLNDGDRAVIKFLATEYLRNLNVDDVGMTDEVLDLMEKLDLEYNAT